MRREFFLIGRIVRVVLVACGFVWLDLYVMTPPSDVASLMCLSIGQLAGLVAVFIPDVHRIGSSEAEDETLPPDEIKGG